MAAPTSLQPMRICDSPEDVGGYVLTEIDAGEQVVWWSGIQRYKSVTAAHNDCDAWLAAQGYDRPVPGRGPLFRFRAAERSDFAQIRDLLEDEERARTVSR